LGGVSGEDPKLRVLGGVGGFNSKFMVFRGFIRYR